MATAYFALKIIRRLRRNRLREEAEDNLRNPILPSNIRKICRICLKDGSIPINGGNGTSDLTETIRTFGDIEVNHNDDFPKYLCRTCYSLLQSAVLFRNLAKESAKLLHENQQRVEVSQESHGNATFTEQDSDHDYEVRQSETPRIFRCKLCRINFNTNEEYAAHQKSRLHRNKRIQCPTCKRVLTATRYRRHLARHQSDSQLICEVCGKMYRKDNLTRHLQLHSFELPYRCQMCPYRGRYVDSLKIHMRTHTGDKPFNCEKCKLRFLTRSNLNRHLLTHKKDRPFKCNECARGFYTKPDLELHFRSDHAGIKDFICRLCGNKYGTRKALMRHELRVHKREKMAKGRLPLYLQTEYKNQR